MSDFASFRDALREALHHLQDPGFEPPDLLYTTLGYPPEGGVGPLQARIVAAIRELERDTDMSTDSRACLYCDSLLKRFVDGLTQEKTAEHLHMSVRNAQRVQRQAIHVLAQRLWENSSLVNPSVETSQAPNWRTQVDREMASLRMNAPHANADVSEVVQSVVDLEAALTHARAVDVEVGFLQQGLVAAVHPHVLRQTLITAISKLSTHVSSSEITIYATLEDGRAKLTLTGAVATETSLSKASVIGDIIVPTDASVDVHRRGDRLYLQILLPTLGERTVLVVEDNADIVYFYRRCTAGTRYRILHAPSPLDLFDRIEEVRPDVIILDIMLPDVDGWQLLTHLSERVDTRDIPVIVSSVVKEEELALALGADAFLSKPIHPSRLVEALDRVLPQASTRSEPFPENSATAS